MDKLKVTTAAVPLLLCCFAGAAQAADTTGCTPQEQQQASQNSGNKLSDNAGVICPPDVDPAMKAPTPKAGNMPVIPPPDSPGGNPNILPK
jgi:hypothetical protein